jgi:hypothetical protein
MRVPSQSSSLLTAVESRGQERKQLQSAEAGYDERTADDWVVPVRDPIADLRRVHDGNLKVQQQPPRHLRWSMSPVEGVFGASGW